MKKQWKPNPRSRSQKEAADRGMYIAYDAFDIPAESTAKIKARRAWFKLCVRNAVKDRQ